MEEQGFERVQDAMEHATELAKTGEINKAFGILDSLLADASREKRGERIRLLRGYAAILADAIGDVRRVTLYKEQSLPYVPDYPFALYNLAELLLRDGQVDLARQYAAKSYELSITEGTESHRQLVTAIVKQWPEID